MKKQLYTLAVMLTGMMAFTSCDKGFVEKNTDPINNLTTTPDKLLAPAFVNSIWPAMSRNRSFNNELMQVTVNMSDADATVFRYTFRSTFSDYLWNAWFVQLTNFKDVYAKAGTEGMLNESYQGIGLIGQAWLYSMLTDTYGDVPYFESNKGDESQGGVMEPAFDAQKDIYLDLFKKLEEANTLLSKGTAITTNSDPVFKGDIARWRKFGNTLYMRLLLRVAGKAEVAQQCIDKIKEIAETDKENYPTMQSNTDAAFIRWTGGASTTDPYTSPYVTGVRSQDFRSPAIGKFFIDHLRDWSDPRLTTSGTYSDGGANRWGIAQGSNGYAGVPSGYAVGAGESKQSYFYSNDQALSTATYGARSLQQNPLTGILMNYAELQFILAEAAVKGWISGSAESYYKAGIAASINYWVPTFSGAANSAELNTYITNADLTWDETGSTEAKMEQLHLQKYYALFLVDMQQWFEYRRTGHPVLPKGPGLMNGGVMPARMTYPVYVQSANPTNYKKAVATQGPDLISTNVWWQKP